MAIVLSAEDMLRYHIPQLVGNVVDSAWPHEGPDSIMKDFSLRSNVMYLIHLVELIPGLEAYLLRNVESTS